ncbi:DUF6329 domain-containing protein [Lachnoclostridium sp. An138]|uniref:DUF6329 domain-containing protein n=1 Tax=Lachnoclostridium sp. An138 TaxID=1965560 RepID=UPI000B372609|nr:DUF6329 domain-containing protein [Lachnoclostridium sp. An138]OUQ15284.1 hypothetical protein B5E82_16180 [Lachnoclostridium sp. An138]
MYTTFDRKPQFHLRNFVIEKTIWIPKEEFASMLGNPMEDKDFIADNKDLMYPDFYGIYHCLLVMAEGRTDGILIESDGYDYARYASYVPDATALSYPSLYAMNRKLADMVDFIVNERFRNITDESRRLSFEELESQIGIPVSGNTFLQDMLGKMLEERPEVLVMEMDAEGLTVRYQLEFRTVPTLADVMKLNEYSDIYLMHPKDVGFIPVSRVWNLDVGKKELERWGDIFNAKVKSIQRKGYGIEIELENISAERLQKFDCYLMVCEVKKSLLIQEMDM